MALLVKLSTDFLETLSGVVDPDEIIQDQEELTPHLSEWRGRWFGETTIMVLPNSTKKLAKIVKLCAKHQIAITCQGGNTGLVGGQIPQGELLLGTAKMNAVRNIDPKAMTITVEAGMSLQAVTDICAEHNLLFALQIASGGSATIGGAIATNAGGMGVLRYGNMRAMVLGLETVMPNGEVWHGLSGLHKDNSGYDLKQLFIGSEGTLGVITAATLQLFPKPANTITAWCGLQNVEDALQLLSHLRANFFSQISKFELISKQALSVVLKNVSNSRAPFSEAHDYNVMVEFEVDDVLVIEEALADALSAEIIADAVIAKSQAEANALLALRENISAAQKPEGAAIKHDISLPLSAIPQFLQQMQMVISDKFLGTRFCVFGHLGDGNLHYNLLQAVDVSGDEFLFARDQITSMVHDLVHEMGGSFAAEHGIGIAKIDDMRRYKSPVELAMMRAVKQAIDPDNIMNPRILFAQKN
ncbi:MAG: FAD-binding oxidoreductase [Robiginitomaculum sp.]|nr:FAD-binding oxidoreductase [Robiginitomaculum sp.]